MVLWLRVLGTLEEDLSSIPSTHTVQLTTSLSPVLGDPMPLSGTPVLQHAHIKKQKQTKQTFLKKHDRKINVYGIFSGL